MRKKKVERLVPLNIMVTPEQMEFVKSMVYGSGDSMARFIRKLIDANRELHDAILQAKKGEEK